MQTVKKKKIYNLGNFHGKVGKESPIPKIKTTTALRRKSAWGKMGEEANTILFMAEEFEMAFPWLVVC